MPAVVETMVSVVNQNMKGDRTVPWHGLGERVDHLMDDHEVLVKSGLDWKVTLEPTYTLHPVTGALIEVPKAKAVMRDRDAKVLGRVGDWYAPFQNADMIDFGSTLVDNFGAKWDTAGALKGGAVTFASFRLADVDVKIGGVDSEQVETYLLLTNAHDGSRAFKAAVVPIRVVCMNTLQWALGSAQSTFSIRHVGNLESRLVEAQRVLQVTTKYMAEFDETAQKLMEAQVTIEEVDEFIKAILPDVEKRMKQVEENRDELKRNILGTPTVPKELRLTKWGLLQGTTEWAEWEKDIRPDRRTNPAERRMLTTLFDGPVAKIRTKAMSLV